MIEPMKGGGYHHEEQRQDTDVDGEGEKIPYQDTAEIVVVR